MRPKQWNKLIHGFKILCANRTKETKYLSLHWISEKSLKDNFKHLFKIDCEFVADLLYKKMANKKNYAKINFYTFAKTFVDFMDESKDKRNRAAFDILEQNNDGQISVITLMDMTNNLHPETPLGKEVAILLNEHKHRNILMREGYSRRAPINFTAFNSLIPNSCLIDEF